MMGVYAVVFLIAVGIIGFGLTFIMVSWFIRKSIRRKQENCTQMVSAKIVEVQKRAFSSNERPKTYSWYPVYEYWIGNETIRVRSNVGGDKRAYQVGESRELLVNPNNPKEFFDPKNREDILQKVFLWVGILVIVAGIIIPVRILIGGL